MCGCDTMQGTVKVKVHLLETLDDGSVDPNCYACKSGQVILTTDGKISSESPAVKDKRLLIKKNGKVDNRSAICRKTIDQDRPVSNHQVSSLSVTQQNTAISSNDSMEADTVNMQQGSARPVVPDCMPTITKTISPVPPPIPPTQSTSRQVLDSVTQITAPQQSCQPSTLASSILQQQQQQQQQQSQPTHLPEKPSTPRISEPKAQQAAQNENLFSVESVLNRACILRSHEFAWAVYSPNLNRGYFTYNFMCFLQRLFHRPVDTEGESVLGLLPFYNYLNQESKDVLSRNLPGCEKELAQRLLGQSLKFLGQSSLSVIGVITSKITEDRPFTNACQTLYQLSKRVKEALATAST